MPIDLRARRREQDVAARFDRVAAGAWSIARRRLDCDAVAEAVVVHVLSDATTLDLPDAELLRRVLDLARHRAGGEPRSDSVERRGDLEVRDAIELVVVGSARVAEVASILDCSTTELSRRIMDAVAGGRTALA